MSELSRIETEEEVASYLQDLVYALDHGAILSFQIERVVDRNRDEHFTNRFTVADLFPDEDPKNVLRRELRKLTVSDYIRTVRDLRFPNKSEMREFGIKYESRGDVFIKIRVELLSDYGNHTVFVMSFHFAERAFTPQMFPYRK